MTISVTNKTTYESCPICQIDYTSIEKNDTKKVVELACTHFFHMQCISDWFSNNQKNEKDLSCGYCAQLSVEKYNPILPLTLESITAFFEEIKKDTNFCSDPNVINCIEKLRSLSISLIDVIDKTSLIDNSCLGDVKKIVEDWIKANIEIELQQIAKHIIVELYIGKGVLNTLDDQIQYLLPIPYDKWPREIETSGAPVYQETDGGLVKMRVSKNYLEKATVACICDRVQKHEVFESHIENIKSFYYYDDGVMNAIPQARNLRMDLADFLEEEPVSSIEEIFSLMEDILKGMHITDDLKEDTRLIMYKFLFNRPALRTVTQEVDRWKKIPVQEWPLFIKGGGVRVLDQDGSVKKYESAHFKKLALAAGGTLRPPIGKIDIARAVILTGIVSYAIFGGLFKRS